MENNAHRPGVVLVLSAPTGGGKTTIAHRFVEATPRAAFSISHTTRSPRPGEREGTDYFFVAREGFEAMRDRGEFAEWAEVHGHFYGTHSSQVRRALEERRDLVLDIDVQGGLQIRRAFRESVLIFLIPPSLEVLLGRLGGRREEPDFNLARRLRTALKELEFAPSYDYIILNADLGEAVHEVRTVVESARLKRGAGQEGVSRLAEEIGNWLRSRDVQSE